MRRSPTKHGPVFRGKRYATAIAFSLLACAGIARAQSRIPTPATRPALAPAGFSHAEILTQRQWRELEATMDRGLAYLASRQLADGSFESDDNGQPAITALGVLAFLSRGHTPDEPPYGEVLARAIDYVISCQQPSGLLCRLTPESKLNPGFAAHTGTYNHAIAGLMLCETFGFVDEAHLARTRDAINAAIRFSLDLQRGKKRNAAETGGWRYLRQWQHSDSDLSVTSWHLMFLRSARNAGFEVPVEPIDEAMKYVQRSFSPSGGFYYGLTGSERKDNSPAIVAAGALSLSLGGMHNTSMARRAGTWILEYRLPQQFDTKRFFYKAFYCTQATFQLGSPYWDRFFPPMLATLVSKQRDDGSWPLEPGDLDAKWGHTYSTAMACLVLGTPMHLLPIFQR